VTLKVVLNLLELLKHFDPKSTVVPLLELLEKWIGVVIRTWVSWVDRQVRQTIRPLMDGFVEAWSIFNSIDTASRPKHKFDTEDGIINCIGVFARTVQLESLIVDCSAGFFADPDQTKEMQECSSIIGLLPKSCSIFLQHVGTMDKLTDAYHSLGRGQIIGLVTLAGLQLEVDEVEAKAPKLIGANALCAKSCVLKEMSGQVQSFCDKLRATEDTLIKFNDKYQPIKDCIQKWDFSAMPCLFEEPTPEDSALAKCVEQAVKQKTLWSNLVDRANKWPLHTWFAEQGVLTTLMSTLKTYSALECTITLAATNLVSTMFVCAIIAPKDGTTIESDIEEIFKYMCDAKKLGLDRSKLDTRLLTEIAKHEQSDAPISAAAILSDVPSAQVAPTAASAAGPGGPTKRMRMRR